jgi:hypothetical protein
MKEIRRQLEALIDKNTLVKALEALADVCGEKAIHIEETWQDKRLAREWMKASSTFWKASQKFKNL